jgi:hypothetical protein
MKGLGEVEVTVSYLRHVGPRYIQGGVTLRCHIADAYSFESLATWPHEESYAATVEDVVTAELQRRLGALPTARIQLTQIVWDDVNSSQEGFRRAAAGAVSALLDV